MPHPTTPVLAPQIHREMLVVALRRIFGEFQEEMLEKLLPQIEWVELAGGDVLFEQDDVDDSLFFVVSGRLRASSIDEAGEQRTIGEIARGETVGEMAFFTGEPRTATVSAVRDSVLAKFTREVFLDFLMAYPLISINMTRLVIERFKRSSAGHAPISKPVTLGCTAITANIDLADFAQKLFRELSRHGKTVLVTAEKIGEWIGDPNAAQSSRDQPELSRRVAAKLEEVEADHQFVLFVTDSTPTAWTRRCLRHCDQILLVADADEPADLHPIEQACLGEGGDASRSVCTLVLKHPQSRRSPKGTSRWFAGRRLAHHLHIRRGLEADWQRVGRVVSGNAVGLVLSGGGARGFAHLGIMKALEEDRLAFDLVSGTSIGAAMAAYAAMDLPAKEMIRLAGEAFKNNPTGDFNLVPLASLIGGRRLKSAIDKAILASCGEFIEIEDLLERLFCISSNYSKSSEAVLARGSLTKSIRASVSIPGALPPVIMDGDLHIDGGTFNNFPTDIMSRMGASRIIGVNLLRDRAVRYEMDDFPTPMALLRDKLRGRRRRKHRVPSITSLLLNTSIMNSYARQNESRKFVDLYFSPDAHRYGMLQWAEYERIVGLGYRHAREVLDSSDPLELDRLRHQHPRTTS